MPIHKILKIAAWVTAVLVGLVLWSYISINATYWFGQKKENWQEKFDSLQTNIELLKKDRQYLEERFNQSVIRMAQLDSVLKDNQQNVNNEIKKLRSADNRFVLAIGDSILRAKSKRQ